MRAGDWTTCSILCWLISAIAGLLVLLVSREPTGFIAALLVGVAFAVFLGLALTRLFCPSSGAESAQANSAAGAPAQTNTGVATKADAENKADTETKAKAETGAKTTTAAASKVAEAAAQPDQDGGGWQSEGTEEGTRPAALSGPREGKADNLKEIKGVGPKLESLCNELGFYHFDQIAAWTADEVAWVDANLKGFKGRVSRDEWVAQARILAAGGETEFSKRVEDGDVY